jgi:lipoate-protein ligase A
VSIGYSQDAALEVDPDQCRKYGIHIVRRQTGGRSILHDDELTYSVVTPENHSFAGSTGCEMYRQFSQILINALRSLAVCGVMAEERTSQENMNGACFSQAARYEITVQGRKLVGSAQKRAERHILQHGSVLLGPGHKRLPMLIPAKEHHRRASMIQTLNNRTISLSEILGRVVHFDELAERVSETFFGSSALSFDSGYLSDDECRDVNTLIRTKYSRPEWTFSRKMNHVE